MLVTGMAETAMGTAGWNGMGAIDTLAQGDCLDFCNCLQYGIFKGGGEVNGVSTNGLASIGIVQDAIRGTLTETLLHQDAISSQLVDMRVIRSLYETRGLDFHRDNCFPLADEIVGFASQTDS